jgi:alpha,alpha-trehalose phosphorylase
VIQHQSFRVEPWCLRETELDLDVLAQSDSVFALSNGHIGWRANLDEGEAHGLPGSYLNGMHELRPLPYAEAGYGYPEASQSVINVTNGKLIRLLVDDEPFDVRYGTLGRVTVTATLQPGEHLHLVKLVACGWSEVRCHPGAMRPGGRQPRRGAPSRLGRNVGRAARLPG